MTTPTQRTLKYLRDRRWTAEVVERWIPWHGVDEDSPRKGNRRDLFGIVDVFALMPLVGALGVQCFGSSGMAEHKRKLQEEPNTALWLEAGLELWLMGWRKTKIKRGGKATKWSPRIVVASLLPDRTIGFEEV